MNTKEEQKKVFQKLFLTGKYTQQEIADKLGVCRKSISRWINESPTVTYIEIRKRLSKELDRLSKNPQGNEELIFKYIQNLDLLDTMIRRAKYLPNIQPL